MGAFLSDHSNNALGHLNRDPSGKEDISRIEIVVRAWRVLSTSFYGKVFEAFTILLHSKTGIGVDFEVGIWEGE